MLKLLITAGLASAPAAHATFDPPDLSFELELHRQYLRSTGMQADTPHLAKDAYLENYKIQQGETLWSLSHVLYGDGNYWPRVWAQNHGITNPHLIRPGHMLQFLMGSEDDTPAFRFTEEDDENGGLELAASSSNPVIEIPPPEIPPKPVLKVPPSFPEWQSVFRRQEKPIIDERGLDFKWKKVQDRVYLRAWVEEKPIEPVGFFLENDKEAGLPVVNQYVFVKMKKGQGQIGNRYMIIHSPGTIRRTTDTYDEEKEAYLMQVAGELEITERAVASFTRDNDKDGYDCFRALITKTTGLSLNSYGLIHGTIPVADLTKNGSHGTTQAQVIGSEKHVASMLYGQGDIVFLDKGTADGVAVGQFLDIFVNRQTRHSRTPVTYSPVPSGTVKVVRTTNGFATAVVLKAHDSILQGDRAQQVSDRSGDTERHVDPRMKNVQGGEIRDGDMRFEMDEQDIEDGLGE